MFSINKELFKLSSKDTEPSMGTKKKPTMKECQKREELFLQLIAYHAKALKLVEDFQAPSAASLAIASNCYTEWIDLQAALKALQTMLRRSLLFAKECNFDESGYWDSTEILTGLIKDIEVEWKNTKMTTDRCSEGSLLSLFASKLQKCFFLEKDLYVYNLKDGVVAELLTLIKPELAEIKSLLVAAHYRPSVFLSYAWADPTKLNSIIHKQAMIDMEFVRHIVPAILELMGVDYYLDVKQDAAPGLVIPTFLSQLETVSHAFVFGNTLYGIKAKDFTTIVCREVQIIHRRLPDSEYYIPIQVSGDIRKCFPEQLGTGERVSLAAYDRIRFFNETLSQLILHIFARLVEQKKTIGVSLNQSVKSLNAKCTAFFKDKEPQNLYEMENDGLHNKGFPRVSDAVKVDAQPDVSALLKGIAWSDHVDDREAEVEEDLGSSDRGLGSAGYPLAWITSDEIRAAEAAEAAKQVVDDTRHCTRGSDRSVLTDHAYDGAKHHKMTGGTFTGRHGYPFTLFSAGMRATDYFDLVRQKSSQRRAPCY